MHKRDSKRSKETFTLELKNDLPQLLEYWIDEGLPFTLYQGGKSYKVEFKGIVYKFLTERIKPQAFVAGNMIKKDINAEQNTVLLSDIRDRINEDDNRYYNSQPVMPHTLGDAYLVDINSAYLTVLLNYGLITEKTFNYTNFKCPKRERLVAVGMLAQRKDIYEFKKGLQISHTQEIAETRFLFNLCVQDVDDAMQKIAKSLPNDYLFYWVDGIYLKSKRAALKAMDILTQLGFKSKLKKLQSMRCFEWGEYKELSFYEVEQDGSKKEKVFHVPNAKYKSQLRKEINKLLIN